MSSLRTAGFIALLSASLLPLTVHAQSEDETVELSSFFASSSYAPDSAYGRERDAAAKPAVAITLRRPATAVVMEVVLQNSADKPDARNREIYATIKELQRAVEATGLKFERREIQLRGDAQRKLVLSSRGGATSYASIAVVSTLSPESDLFELVRMMRTVVSGVNPSGATKVFDGAVSLMIENPASYRQELLKEIFADLAFVQQSLGNGFEVLPSKLDGPVRVRAASEREVELWIDYSFTIRSKLELTNPPPARG